MKNWLKGHIDPRAQLESLEVDRLKRGGADKAEIEPQRQEIRLRIASMEESDINPAPVQMHRM